MSKRITKQNAPPTKEEEINSLIVSIRIHEERLKLFEDNPEQLTITRGVIKKYKEQLYALRNPA